MGAVLARHSARVVKGFERSISRWESTSRTELQSQRTPSRPASSRTARPRTQARVDGGGSVRALAIDLGRIVDLKKQSSQRFEIGHARVVNYLECFRVTRAARADLAVGGIVRVSAYVADAR